MSKGEVITLQLGSFSNFAASHLWNLQSSCFYYTKDAPFGHEFNHDVYYREGRNMLNKTTFTPRTVLVDLKGSVGNCAWPVDQAYDGPHDAEQKIWDGRVQIHKAEPQATSSKSEELGEVDVGPKKPTVQKKSWAGYLLNKYHPKSKRGETRLHSNPENHSGQSFPAGGVQIAITDGSRLRKRNA